jgi:hypothetical protein
MFLPTASSEFYSAMSSGNSNLLNFIFYYAFLSMDEGTGGEKIEAFLFFIYSALFFI